MRSSTPRLWANPSLRGCIPEALPRAWIRVFWLFVTLVSWGFPRTEPSREPRKRLLSHFVFNEQAVRSPWLLTCTLFLLPIFPKLIFTLAASSRRGVGHATQRGVPAWELEYVRNRFADFKRHVEELEEATEDSLEEARKACELAWKDLEHAVDSLSSALA